MPGPYVLRTEPLESAADRKEWCRRWQSVVPVLRREVTYGPTRRSADIRGWAIDLEVQQSREYAEVLTGRRAESERRQGVLFAAINAHFDGRLVLARDGLMGVRVDWASPWMLPARISGEKWLDLGASSQFGDRHVLVELQQFSVTNRWGIGFGVAVCAQSFAQWLDDGTPPVYV